MSKIFFIRGHAKSGTNWLCNIVNLHPEIMAKGEFHLENLCRGLSDTLSFRWGLLKRNEEVLKNHFEGMIKNVIVEICGGLSFCGDRTPGGIMEATIPGEKCLYITRDGRDVLVSWIFHAFRHQLHKDKMMKKSQLKFDENPDYFESRKHELLESEDFVRGFSKKWNDFVLRDLALMESADKGAIDLDYLHIRYEDLHDDLETQRIRIYRFFSLDPAIAKPINPISTPGFGRIDNKAFYRRGETGAWRDYFTTEQHRWFLEEAGGATKELDLDHHVR